MTGLLITDLSAGYKKRKVINGLSLPAIPPGSLLGLLGPNASGKSTLLRAIAGLSASTGRIELNGKDLVQTQLAARAGLIGYLPQALPPSTPLIAYEAVMSACRAVRSDLDKSTVEQALEDAFRNLGIGHLALERMSQLSGGQRQMVGLAQVMVRQPQLLLLDEPTSALDLRWQLSVIGAVRDMLKKTGAIAVMAIHDINLAIRTCDQLAVIADGAVVSSGASDMVITADIVAKAYGVSSRVEACSRGIPVVIVDGPLALQEP
jgi:iron complex transport system ATP-binding protein